MNINKVLETVTNRLIEKFDPEQIFLFGSHAWGAPHQDSDLDILVIVKNSEFSPTQRASLAYRHLRDIPYPLDILVKTRTEINKYAHVPVSLEHQILQKGKLIYG